MTARRKKTSRRRPAKRKEAAPGEVGAENHAFEALLDYLKRNRGFDFTGYKRSTLVRRVSKRMGEVRTGDYDSQVLSVFSMVRKYWGFGAAPDLAKVHNDLCRRADEIAGEKVVPVLVNPLAQAIASRP